MNLKTINTDITLQINVSPGDINYAEITVPAIVSNHQDIQKRLLIVDCCRPQKTKLIDPDKKFPKEIFSKKVEKIIEISEKLLKDGIITDVYYLKPNDPIINKLAKKYLRNMYNCTHAAGGTANMSYWAAIELVETKYVLHYDGDILIYQDPNFNWVNEAKSLMEKDKDVVISVPRLCPPIKNIAPNTPSLHEGRPLEEYPSHWLNDWFSTRHFLLDKSRFEKFLPLPYGKIALELLIRKYGKRAFPIDPEILMFKSIGRRNGKRLILKNELAWFSHPTIKNDDFIAFLPRIIHTIGQGFYPAEQVGYEDLNLEAWITYLNNRQIEEPIISTLND